jgi:surfactin synthase thioesterase subunit
MKKPQIFLIHFAGGNYYSFQFILPFLQEFDALPLELPGRGRRMGEMLLRDFEQAARDIHGQLVRRIGSAGFMLYGHSMGACLALRVANLLEAQGHCASCVAVSGNAGPGSGKRGRLRYTLPRDEFMQELKQLGGIPPGLMEDNDLYGFFEPILRADMEIAETADLGSEPAIAAPLFAMMGSEEEQVEQITNWSRFTRSHFDYALFEGDHFFIRRHPAKIAGILKNCMSVKNTQT